VEAQAVELDEIEGARAEAFRLQSALLARPPTTDLLLALSRIAPDDSAWGQGLRNLGAAAGAASEREVEREFNRLFIGMTRGELVPYASFYVTGFLQDRPLVAVRRDMEALDIARRSGVGEPEDHIAALLEMMAGLITGRFAAEPGGSSITRQRQFFEAHLLPWAPLFFRDLAAAEAARFYRPVAALGLLLLEIERQGLEFD
jgi:TorA maturation chaperone TorD